MIHLLCVFSFLLVLSASPVFAQQAPALKPVPQKINKQFKVHILNPNGIKGSFTINSSDLTVKNLYIQVHQAFGPGKIILLGRPLPEFARVNDRMLHHLLSDSTLHFLPEK